MMQLICRKAWFSSANKNLLKNFGIVNPNIVRNLRYSPPHAASQNSTKVASTISPQTPTQNPTKSPALALLWPSQVPELGTPLLT
jgi:hypothetical protein